MAPTMCPKCGSEVPSHYGNCPKCAYPIASGGTARGHGGNIQTPEQTPKRYKLQQLIAALMIIGGIIAMFVISTENHPSPGVEAWGLVGSVVGLFWLIKVRVKIWWDNR